MRKLPGQQDALRTPLRTNLGRSERFLRRKGVKVLDGRRAYKCIDIPTVKIRSRSGNE